jgi:hypothetical protein
MFCFPPICKCNKWHHPKHSSFNFKIVWTCMVIDSLWIKPTDALSSSFIGITTLHVSGSLSAHHQEFLAVHRNWYNLCSLVTRCYRALGSTWPPNCINCTNAVVRLITPDDGQKDCSKHVVVIPTKLELSASLSFIHKESITMHYHTVFKKCL